MPLAKRYWRSGQYKQADRTVPSLLRSGEYYHVVDYDYNDRCLVVCDDNEEHWFDNDVFRNSYKTGIFFQHIKNVAGLAGTAYAQNGEQDDFILLHRMYLLIRFLHTNSLVVRYDEDTVMFVFDPYYEADKEHKTRTMSWAEFEKFVVKNVFPITCNG